MSTMTDEISNVADLLDVRDIIQRVEDLRGEMVDDDGNQTTLDDADSAELATLEGLLSDLKGAEGDEPWEGDWYPATLIHEDYFEDYARQLAEDIGAIPTDYSWPTSHIDWEAATSALLMDYTSVDFDGQTYYTR